MITAKKKSAGWSSGISHCTSTAMSIWGNCVLVENAGRVWDIVLPEPKIKSANLLVIHCIFCFLDAIASNMFISEWVISLIDWMNEWTVILLIQ